MKRKRITICLVSGMFIASSTIVLGVTREFDRGKICAQANAPECDFLVEGAIAKEIPGVIERRGPLLRIHTRNGKTLERRNSAPTIRETKAWERWVCEYVRETGYLEVCYRLYESSKTEFVNINSGSSVSIDGWPIYSPSRRRVLMVDGYGGDVYTVQIWRLDAKRVVREFRLTSPPGPGEMWELPIWKSEDEIVPNPAPDSPRSSYRLVRKGAKWILYGK